MTTKRSLPLDTVYRHAERLYPEECCGFIHADGHVHQGVNIQGQLHQREPELYSRTAENGYTLSIADTVALNKSFTSSNPAHIIYHSHPDVGAYFSREDKHRALYMGEPIYPVQHLVIDVRSGRAQGAKLFAWDGHDFICLDEFA